MQRWYFIRFFKPVLALVLAMAAAAVLALPSPKDIDAAVSAGHLSQAETMLREVIQEKPQSAKAHYELGQVLARQARYADAEKALIKAKEIDPTLKFAVSPEKFNDTFDKVARKARDLTGSQVTSGLNEANRTSTVPVPAEPSFRLHYVWIGISALVVLALVLRRNKTNSAPQTTTYASTTPAGTPSGTAFGSLNPQGYGPQGYPVQPPTGGMGSGIGGAVVGGLAGVAAGYALSKALEGDHHSNAVNASPNPASHDGYVPFDSPSQPDLGSFDSGSGSGWDDGGSDTSSEDNW